MSARPTVRSTRWWLGVPLGLLLVAGCSAGAGEDPDAEAPSSAGGSGEEGSTGSDAGAALAIGSTSLGDVVVDADGMTLYMFDEDAQGEPSTCYDGCASAWPPLLTEGEPQAGDGVDPALLGVAERTDGTAQVTYDGWPLYYWAQDGASGDVAGQGVNDVWWVLGADGVPIRG